MNNKLAMKKVDDALGKMEKDLDKAIDDIAPPPKVAPAQLTTERGKTHGPWVSQSFCAHELKGVVRGYLNRGTQVHSPSQMEAVEMICVKLSRICAGNPNEPDHWDDIAGYAHLGKTGENG